MLATKPWYICITCLCLSVSVCLRVYIYTGYTPSYSRGAYGSGVSGGVGDTSRYGGYANSSGGVGGDNGSLYGSRDR